MSLLPRNIVSWNANGLAPQLKHNWSTLEQFLTTFPWDVLFVQEARLPAHGPPNSKKGDGVKRERGRIRNDGKGDFDLVQRTLIKLARNIGADVYWTLADWKYAGSACLVKTAYSPNKIEYTIPQLANVKGHFDPQMPSHHPDGRIIRLHYDSFQVLQTYSPNNGKDAASFNRRKLWDAALLDFCKTEDSLIWMGDLNVAPMPCDVSHPAWFAAQNADICLPPGCRGQPGFTPDERQRFSELLEQGSMVDAFRHFHPRDSPPPIEGDEYSWRGAAPVAVPVARYYGKGMRIDHALVKTQLMPRIEAVTLCGHGKDRHGFLGSDHCPVSLRLAEVGVQSVALQKTCDSAAQVAEAGVAHEDDGESENKGQPSDAPSLKRQASDDAPDAKKQC